MRQKRQKPRNKINISLPLFVAIIVCISAGFFAGLFASDTFQEAQPSVIAISDGENTTYLELHEGWKTTLTFLNGENMSINNIGKDIFIESLDKGIASVTQDKTSDEQYNLMGEAAKKTTTPTTPTSTCTDSDANKNYPGGKNYYEKGTMKVGTSKFTDLCFGGNNQKLMEYFCSGNVGKSIQYSCLSEHKLCQGGACKGAAEKTCLGEGESKPVIANPLPCCEGLKLIPPKTKNVAGIYGYCTAKCGNGVCEGNETEYNCLVDCGNIRTNSTKCTDSDGGINYFVQGTCYVIGFGDKVTDKCPKGGGYDNWVEEYYCDYKYDFGWWFCTNTYEKCDIGCKDGACIKTECDIRGGYCTRPSLNISESDCKDGFGRSAEKLGCGTTDDPNEWFKKICCLPNII